MARRPSRATPKLDPSMRVVLLVGKETLVRDEHLRSLQESLEKAHGEVQIVRFRAGECDLAEVLDEARTAGLLCPHKLVIVAGAQDIVTGDAARRVMERFCAEPPETATLALLADTWRKGKLDALIEKHGAIVHCEALSPADTLRWIPARARSTHGATIEPDAARMLLDRLGTDLQELDGHLAKLASVSPTITSEMVDRLVARSREEVVWDLQARVLASPPAHAVRGVREALTISRHPPVLVSYALMDLTRKLCVLARAIDDRIPSAQASKGLRLWGESARMIEQAARAMGPERCARLFDTAVRLDAALKSGHSDPERALERLALAVSRQARTR